MGVSAMGNSGAGTGCGQQTGSSLSETPRLKTRDRNANVQKCGSLFCILAWTAQLWKVPWGQGWVREPGHCLWSSSWPGESCCPLLPSAAPQSCALPSRDILAGGGTSQSQLKNAVMDGSAVVQGWPHVVKSHMPPAGVTHCHSGLVISFLLTSGI